MQKLYQAVRFQNLGSGRYDWSRIVHFFFFLETKWQNDVLFSVYRLVDVATNYEKEPFSRF